LDPIIDAFLARLEELKSQYISHIASGSPADYTSYQKLCGSLEGLSIAERELKDIISNVMGDEDPF